MVFQITPIQVYRTNVTFPRSILAKEKDPKKIKIKPEKLKQIQRKLKQNQKCNHSYFYAIVWIFEVNHV